MALFLKTVSFFVIFVSSELFRVSEARRFYVGGNGGWETNPPENYNAWAGKTRFRINDTLHFKYAKGSDSVLQVSKEDYDSCSTINPIKKMDDGDSEFLFDRSGPFYFISGNEDHCKKGQKLIIVVMSVGQTPPAAQPPQAASPPKSSSPVSHPPPSSPTLAPQTSPPGTQSPTAQPPHATAPGKSPPSAPSPKSSSPVTPPPSSAPSSSISQPPTGSPSSSHEMAPSTLPSSPSPSENPPISMSPSSSPADAPTLPELSPSLAPSTSAIPPSSDSATSPSAEAPGSTGDITAPGPSPGKSSGSMLTVMSVTTAMSLMVIISV